MTLLHSNSIKSVNYFVWYFEGKNWKIYTHPSLLIQCVKIFQSNLRSHAQAVTIQTIWCKKRLVRPFFPISSQWSHLIA